MDEMTIILRSNPEGNNMTMFKATDVLDVKADQAGRAGVWFLNWKIKAKAIQDRSDPSPEVYAGAGLYGLCFNNELIYIGSFLGNDKGGANFSGDVVALRWWTHIGSITARGHRVHIARRSLIGLQGIFGVNHVMVAGFQSATVNTQLLHKDQGNLAPKRRLAFAGQLSHVFHDPIADPLDVLSGFTFVYERIAAMPDGMNSKSLKSHIESAEKKLIQRLAPKCNSTHLSANLIEPVQVSCSDVPDLLRNALAALQPGNGIRIGTTNSS